MQAILLGIATLAVSAYWWGRLTGPPDAVITHSESAVAPVPAESDGLETQSKAGREVAASGTPAPSSTDTQAEWQTGYPTGADTDAAAAALMDGPVYDDAVPDVSGASKPQAPPSPVRVSINVRSWGAIMVNAVSRGVTPPLKTLRLVPGRYSVTIRNAAQTP